MMGGEERRDGEGMAMGMGVGVWQGSLCDCADERLCESTVKKQVLFLEQKRGGGK